MTVIGLDDTDSRTEGMCTTYVATRLAGEIEAAGGHVERLLLIRLNPAVAHKTRGNAALAIHCSFPVERARKLTADHLGMAATGDERTSPGAVIAPGEPDAVPERIGEFATQALRVHHDLETACSLAADAGFETLARAGGRGRIGALAAVGSWRAFEDWTYECISYRERSRWGTERDVDFDSVVAAADSYYPTVWDTLDREEATAVCVPHTPCPILHGIRGDEPGPVRTVAADIESEPVETRQLFVTNQGTDAHLASASLGDVRDGRSYRVTGTVDSPPETREGGHVFFQLAEGEHRLRIAAFEPTKRFRDHVRRLRVGDRLTACGEVSQGTLKLEKFALREPVETELVTPTCPDCGRSMSSAGRNAGYRCRDCNTSRDGKTRQKLERTIERGWYEVPPCARRHIAKPLVRGGFDAPVHPER